MAFKQLLPELWANQSHLPKPEKARLKNERVSVTMMNRYSFQPVNLFCIFIASELQSNRNVMYCYDIEKKVLAHIDYYTISVSKFTASQRVT